MTRKRALRARNAEQYLHTLDTRPIRISVSCRRTSDDDGRRTVAALARA